MKKSIQMLVVLTCVLTLVGFTTTKVFGQNATSTWALSSTTTRTAAVTGNVTAELQDTLGYRIRDYAGTNTSQRGGSSVMPAGTYGGWPAIETGPQANRFLDFKVTPTTGNDFIVTSISLAVGNSGGSVNLRADISISTDSTTWTTLESVVIPNTAMTTKTYTTGLPRVNDGQKLYLRVSPWAVAVAASGKYFNIQNVVVSGTTITAGLTPTIVTTGTLSDFGSVTIGSTSSEQFYTVSGTDLLGDIVITAPANFEVSTTSGSGFGSSITLTQSGGSVATTTVYVRFAPSSIGVKSGNISHTSMAATIQNVAASGTGVNIPTLNTPTSSAVTTNSATLGGTIASDNGSTITASGVAYATSADPTSPTVETSPLVTSGALTVNVSSLSSNTLYHYRAYAANAVGTGYVVDATFTTLPNASTAIAATAIGAAGFTANWNAVSGSEAVTYRLDVSTDNGFGSFVIGYENLTVDGTSTAVTGLTSETSYYYRVRAVNAAGTSDQSSTITVVTLGSSAPLVESPISSNIGSTTATLGAEVTSDGNMTLIEKGVVWSFSADPTTADTKVIEGTTVVESYLVAVTGLPAATVIHYRGYAINAIGTGYTSDATILTLSNEPSTAAGSLAATVISNYQVDLSWSTAIGASGYIVLQRTGADPTGLPLDATAYAVGNTIGDASVAAVVTSGATTSASITGLTTGIDYHFSIIPFAWNNVDAGTYNYKTDGTIPTTNVTIIARPYRSLTTGNWSAASSWEKFDGSNWVAATVFPNSTDGTITILNGHTITLDTSIAIDQTVVDAGGAMKIGVGKILTVANGADSVDFVVSGTVDMFGTVLSTSLGRISIENGGLYKYSVPAGADIAMPVYTWRTGSTCRVDSTSGSTPTNLRNQSLCNLIWNGTNSGANGGPNFASGTVITGDLTVLSSKNYQWRVANLSGGANTLVTIRGNVNVSGATATLTSTGSGADTLAKITINVDGNVNVTAGTWSLNNSSNVYAVWNIKGNINVTGGTLQSGASGWYGRRTLNFAGGTTQSFTVTSPGTIGTAASMFKVSNGSTVDLGFPWTLMANGALNLESGKIITTATNLLTIPATGNLLGGSSSAYVDGPLAIVVASTSPTTKSIPVGKGTAARPISLTVNHDATTATTYTTEVFNTAPTSRTLPLSLLSVSSVRYVNIVKGTGANLSSTLGATITMSYDADDGVTHATAMRAAKDDGAGSWLNIGGSGTANTTGTITSNTFYSFSDFVLAVADTNFVASTPTLLTTGISTISTTFATSGGNVTNDGGAAVTARGVCWNTTGTPTDADSKTTNGTGSGVFTSSVTGLTPGITYYLRAYATNSAGTGYGEPVTFSTLAALLVPTVTTTDASNIQVTTAISGGAVTDWGGVDVTARGICWNTTGSPTVSGSHSTDGSGLGSYASGLSPLVGGTMYYVRAYATNSVGTGYGNEVTFTTQTPQADVMKIVAKDGSGDFLTVQAAFRDVPTGYTGQWTIFVKKGVYYEKDTLAAGKINVSLIGEDRDSTIITYDDYSDRYGTGVPGTSGTFTIAIDASDFTAKNITFENSYWPNKYGVVTGTQGVALRTQGDRHEYINCKFLGYQDTYYTWGGNGTGRMYHKNCIIEGSVDFIFGRNICVFDSCTIKIRRNAGVITAGATDASSLYGYVFRNCTLTTIDTLGYDGVPVTTFYLGRPWQGSPRTVFINSYEPSTLLPAGWTTMSVSPGLYAEYNCYGPGSATGSRVMSSQLTGPTSSTYSLTNIFARTSAVSSLILYNWMPASVISDQPLQQRITASAGSNGSIAPVGISNVIYTGSQSYTVTPASGYSVDSVSVDGVSVGAVTNYNFTNITANHTILANFTGMQSVNISMGLGWNLVSVPNSVATWTPPISVFTGFLGDCFKFQGGGYSTVDTLAPGLGYWVYYTAPTVVPVTGGIRTATTIQLELGWNLIGSREVDIPFSSLTTNPAGRILGDLFRFNNALGGYETTTDLKRGDGAWLYVTSACTLTIP